jgi:ATP-dependent helicase/nuclease subunit A
MCPRRYHYFHVLGLGEHPAPARASSTDSVDAQSGLDPLRRGTLAHRLLERCDFARSGSDLDQLLAHEGYSLAEPEVAEVRAHVAAFLSTDFARKLIGIPVRRELPFLVSVPLDGGGELYLRGQIDLLQFDHDGVTVIDYKHARRGEADDYRFQLQAYSLAARRLYPQAPTVRTGLVFLKEADPTPSLEVAGPSAPFEQELRDLGQRLSSARANESWSGLPIDTCRRLRCGYVYRCHPGDRR